MCSLGKRKKIWMLTIIFSLFSINSFYFFCAVLYKFSIYISFYRLIIQNKYVYLYKEKIQSAVLLYVFPSPIKICIELYNYILYIYIKKTKKYCRKYIYILYDNLFWDFEIKRLSKIIKAKFPFGICYNLVYNCLYTWKYRLKFLGRINFL